MRGCAWSLVGLLISVRVGAATAGTMAGTRSLVGLLISVRVGAAAAGSTMAVTSAHPAGRRRLTYEYAPTENVMPYCRLQSSAACWGNTHRFLEVTTNGPLSDGRALEGNYPSGEFIIRAPPALGDLDGDGDMDLVVGESDGVLTYIENTGTSTAPVFVQRIGSANPLNGIDVGGMSAPAFADLDNDGTLRPRLSIDKLRPHVLRLAQATWTS